MEKLQKKPRTNEAQKGLQKSEYTDSQDTSTDLSEIPKKPPLSNQQVFAFVGLLLTSTEAEGVGIIETLKRLGRL